MPTDDRDATGTPEIPEQLWGLYDYVLGWNGTLGNDTEILAYTTREAADADNRMEPSGLYGVAEVLGVHPSWKARTESAEGRLARLVEGLRGAANGYAEHASTSGLGIAFHLRSLADSAGEGENAS